MQSLDDRVPGPVIAGLLGISVVNFHQLIGKGIIERQGRKGYPLRDTVKAFCEYWRKIAAGRGEEGEQKTLSSARARAALAQAEQMELRTQIARGNYVPKEELRLSIEDLPHQHEAGVSSRHPASGDCCLLGLRARCRRQRDLRQRR
jgi:phage terminase Nu1 subunit (DNA packaging protein)